MQTKPVCQGAHILIFYSLFGNTVSSQGGYSLLGLADSVVSVKQVGGGACQKPQDSGLPHEKILV